ncbi:MAG TPA: lipopolysaccharide biosynthesis protein [Gemmatimonadales bacterium]|nr:lipopolysaccharide biosynthesis protein [Gemmatimonadales bacterium]
MLLGRALVGASGFLRTLILARLLSPHDFGAMGATLVVLNAVEALTETGYETALVQRRDDVDRFYDTAFTIQVIRGLVLAVLLWLAAPLAAAFFREPVLVPVLRATAVVVILRGVANPARVRWIRDLRFDTLFWWRLPEVVVTLVVAITLGFVLRNVWALVIAFIASQVTSTVASHIVARRPVHLALDRERIRELTHYGKWVLATQVMTFLSLQGDNAFVARALGVAALGFYQVAFRIAELPIVGLTQVVTQVGLPSLSALHRERERLAAWYFAAQRLVLAAHGAFVVVVLLFGGAITRVILGARWLPIVPALKILVVGMLFRSVVTLGATLFNALGEPRFAYQLNAVHLVIMAATIYPLTQWMGGLEGVATAVSLSLVGATVLYVWRVRVTLGLDWREQLAHLAARFSATA